MKVAVTGATGFIGRHVLAEITQHPVDVVAVLHDATQRATFGSALPTVVVDVATPPSDSFDVLGRPDVLIHLAWGGLPHYRSLHHVEFELPHQFQFLAQLVRSGLPALLVTGTCLEYGMQSGPLTETQDTQPNTPYGLAKDSLRRQLEFLRNCHPFALTWTRLFYIYGEGQAPHSLSSQLSRAAARGDSTFDMSGGEQLRDFMSVRDAAKVLVDLALRQADIGVVNVCSGIPTSVRGFVERWLRENACDMQLNRGHYPYPAYEPMAFWGDGRKLATYMGPS